MTSLLPILLSTVGIANTSGLATPLDVFRLMGRRKSQFVTAILCRECLIIILSVPLEFYLSSALMIISFSIFEHIKADVEIN